MPFVGEKFKTYKDFALASLKDIYTPTCLSEAKVFKANNLHSVCLINDGHGKFTFKPLPHEAQIAPLFGMAVLDFNQDGNLDLVGAQNFFTPQKETFPMNGGVGLVLRGMGNGSFETLRADESGLFVPGDAKSLTVLDHDQDGYLDLCIAANRGMSKCLARSKEVES